MKFIFVTIRIFEDYLYASDQGGVVRKAVNVYPGLRVDQSMNFSSIQKFFTAFESWAPCVV